MVRLQDVKMTVIKQLTSAFCVDPKITHVLLQRSGTVTKKNEQQEINRLMSIGSLSYSEVREKYSFHNSFEVLQDKDYEIDFPEPPNQRKTNVRNNVDEMNRSIRRHNTFSDVSKHFNKNVTVSQSSNLIQAEPLDYGNQSIFNSSFTKTSEAERLFYTLMKTYQRIADDSKDEELSKSLKATKNAFQSLVLCNDNVLIKLGIDNGEGSTSQHSKLK